MMKKIVTLFVAAIALLATSCNNGKEELVAPIEQFNIAKIEVVAIEGHLHGKYGFHETADPVGQVYMKRFSKFVFEKQADGTMALAPNSETALRATGGVGHGEEHADAHEEEHHHDESEAGSVYGIWIDYFDSKGTKITEKVLGGDNGKRLQHFFVPREIKPTFDGIQSAIDQHKDVKQFMTYIYCDTDPLTARIKDGAPVSGEKNPIGHKGYLGFFVPRSQFALDIILSDVGGKTKSPQFWNTPSMNQPIVKLTIPVVVYAHFEETIENDNMADLTDADRKYLEAAARAYGITIDQALQALVNRVEGDVPPHSDAGYWF
ncbi:MAG: hypothetical protein PUK66_04820 [Bacteroidales bacterium]|uniref:hypothetical protein n=1 Tax=Porphyromonas sp. TaxID=1924944 RepID=UPI0029755F12|nr:hypothetical protein [Porphyromonas sp.]MDD7438148.1 hypothetical protein [Bacteroidales bacterium]MDY3066795.1 hypothetical protein [Porphyromonas sp.]